MTSENRVEANRMNALKSTGPKTAEGKAIAKMNALRHGLLSSQVLVAGEKGKDLEELGQRLRSELRPVGELEHLLVDRIVSSVWRLRRCLRLESGVVEHEEMSVEPFDKDWETGEEIPRTRAEMRQLQALQVTEEGERLERLMRYESTIERQIYRALGELERLQKARTDMPFTSARVIDVEPTAPKALPAPDEGPDATPEMGSFGENAAKTGG